MTSHLKGPSDGEWSVFAEKVVAERDEALAAAEEWNREVKSRQRALEVAIEERTSALVERNEARECEEGEREARLAAEAERDEARAEVARLQDLHTRCAAFDDQPGPSCVRLAADAARLREALERLLKAQQAVSKIRVVDGDEYDDAVDAARAALKETP